MAYKSSRAGRVGRPLGEINMIPLIDVMLVLLIVFMVTAPLLTHAVKIDLPKAASQPNRVTPDHIQLAIRASGEWFWNGAPVSFEDLEARLKAEAAREPQPELHLHADARTPYEPIARTLALASSAGLAKIAFVSDPKIPASRP